jgi:hypothetical protein
MLDRNYKGLLLFLVLRWWLMLFIPDGFVVRSLSLLVSTHHFELSILDWLVVPSQNGLINGYTK